MCVCACVCGIGDADDVETGIVCLVIGLLKCESSSWLMGSRHAIEWLELFLGIT